jgi:hypothetical protein
METVEGLMQSLKLSAAERKGFRIMADEDSSEGEETLHQTVGKLFSEKRVRGDTLVSALGGIWCPLKGLECYELGENIFLITFHQPSGKKKALEDGPWMLADEILVMVDLDESKSLDELEFNCVSIWVRISQIPIGMMNNTTSEVLGIEIGEFVEADIGPGGNTTGKMIYGRLLNTINTEN